jgi:hypothetical protein
VYPNLKTKKKEKQNPFLFKRQGPQRKGSLGEFTLSKKNEHALPGYSKFNTSDATKSILPNTLLLPEGLVAVPYVNGHKLLAFFKVR